MKVEAKKLDKRFKDTHAVNNVSFTLQSGKVTGFLGPNGSGKSTTMKLMVDLQIGSGKTLYNGKQLKEYSEIGKLIGVHFGTPSFYPNRTAEKHLHLLAKSVNIDKKIEKKRVDEVIDMVGLSSARKKKPKQYSMGMVQRLGIASAILLEPKMLMLDEPANGLDPQSIQWLRQFLKDYAAKGNIVFVSSHLLSEMQLLADDLVIIASGQIKATGSMDEFIAGNTKKRVIVDSPTKTKLKNLLRSESLDFTERKSDKRLVVSGVGSESIGNLCANSSLVLNHLEQAQDSLEDVFLSLTSEEQQFATKDLQ